MSSSEVAVPVAPPSDAASAARERSFRLVLIGLVLLITGFTIAAIANGLYPCVPAAGSGIEPPPSDCAVTLSPWAAVALVGLILAVVGYRRAA